MSFSLLVQPWSVSAWSSQMISLQLKLVTDTICLSHMTLWNYMDDSTMARSEWLDRGDAYLVSASRAWLWLGAPGQVSNRDPVSNPETEDICKSKVLFEVFFWHWTKCRVLGTPPNCNCWSSRMSSKAFRNTAFPFLIIESISLREKHCSKCLWKQTSNWLKAAQMSLEIPSSTQESKPFNDT